MTAAAVGTPVTFVIDHLTPDAARRILALFDRPHGTELEAGQVVDLSLALNRLPHGDAYGQIIGVWTCLQHAAEREAWIRDGAQRILDANAERRAASIPAPVARGRRGVRRGRVVDAAREFGRDRRAQ
jgi:hypothetical protein